MDEAKRSQIEERIKDCEIKIANEQAKLIRYQAQLKNNKVGHTKARVKTDQKQAKNTPKTVLKPIEKNEEKGFLETIFS